MWRLLPVLLVAVAMCACASPQPPILVQDGAILVENQSSVDWRDVRIIVNDHFAGGAAVLEAGRRLNAPLTQFRTAYGQPFDRGRQQVTKVEVTATDSSGAAVALNWALDPRDRERNR